MAKVAGTAFFKVDGQQYKVRGNMKISIGDRERESVVGLDGYHGIKEMPVPSSIEVDITDEEDLDLNVLQDLNDVTVQAELINGKQAVLRNASQINNLELDASEGLVTLRFEGPKGRWLKPQGV